MTQTPQQPEKKLSEMNRHSATFKVLMMVAQANERTAVEKARADAAEKQADE